VDKQLDLLQGTLDMLILKAVSLGPLHGYGILLRIQQISKIGWKFNKAPSTRRFTGWRPGMDHQRMGRIGNKRKAQVLPAHRRGQRRFQLKLKSGIE